MARRFLAVGLSLLVATPAFAGVPVQRDQLTVSGRFEVARASNAPLKSGLTLSDVQVDGGVLAALGGKPALMKSAVQESMEASLRNFGYLGDATATPVAVLVEPLDVKKEQDSTTAVVRIDFKASGDSEAARCVPATAEASFKAIKPIHTSAGNGERMAGVVAMIAFAAAGYNAGQLMSGQFASAKAQDRAFNAQRVVGKGEGVALAGGDTDLLQFAVMHATQLAMADFIRQLGASPCGQPSPATTSAAVATPEAVPEITPAATTQAPAAPATTTPAAATS